MASLSSFARLVIPHGQDQISHMKLFKPYRPKNMQGFRDKNVDALKKKKARVGKGALKKIRRRARAFFESRNQDEKKDKSIYAKHTLDN